MGRVYQIDRKPKVKRHNEHYHWDGAAYPKPRQVGDVPSGGCPRLLSEIHHEHLNSYYKAKRRRECHGIWKANSDDGGVCDRCSGRNRKDPGEGDFTALPTRFESQMERGE